MTTNAFIFSWDTFGIEAIIPITAYENIDKDNLMNILAERPKKANPLDSIIFNLIIRARSNAQRHYEIYAIDCDSSLNEDFWRTKWKTDPQFCANLIREKGHKLYSDRLKSNDSVIV